VARRRRAQVTVNRSISAEPTPTPTPWGHLLRKGLNPLVNKTMSYVLSARGKGEPRFGS